jgi:hypothetical protein
LIEIGVVVDATSQLLPTRIAHQLDGLIDEFILGKNTILIASGWGMVSFPFSRSSSWSAADR